MGLNSLFVIEFRSQIVSQVTGRQLVFEQSWSLVSQLDCYSFTQGSGLDDVPDIFSTKSQVDWLSHIDLDTLSWFVHVNVTFQDNVTGTEVTITVEFDVLLGDYDLQRLTQSFQVSCDFGKLSSWHGYCGIKLHLVDLQEIGVEVHQLQAVFGYSVLLLVFEQDQDVIWIVLSDQREVISGVTVFNDLVERFQIDTQGDVSVTSVLFERLFPDQQRDQQHSGVVHGLDCDTVFGTVEVT